jgi:hypothetical protein
MIELHTQDLNLSFSPSTNEMGIVNDVTTNILSLKNTNARFILNQIH